MDGSVRIEAADRAGQERRLRYCARPPFALDRLRELDPERLVYHPKRGPGGSGPLLLTPLELLDRRAAHYAWALLLARIYDVFPLRCTHCGGAMRIIAFGTDAATVRNILAHLGQPIAPPRIAPARGPPLWEAAGAEPDPTPVPVLAPTPAYEFDPRLTW